MCFLALGVRLEKWSEPFARKAIKILELRQEFLGLENTRQQQQIAATDNARTGRQGTISVPSAACYFARIPEKSICKIPSNF
jgi:hypothetical protein